MAHRIPLRLATLLTLVGACVASAAPMAAATSTAGPAPGPTTSPITLTAGYVLSGYDVAVSRSGEAFIGWIANTSKTNGATRAVHLCEVKPNTTSCSGGIRVVDSLGDYSAEGLRVLARPSGTATLVWFYEDVKGGHIGTASTNAAGILLPAVNAGSAPRNGQIFDAELGPDDVVWTVSGPSSGNGMQVRAGSGDAVNVKTPYSVGYAELAFAGATPVIATQQSGSITGSAGYTYYSHGAWTAVHKVAGTWAAGYRLGLTETRSGLRLTASEPSAGYRPVVSDWTGSGFSKPKLTGDDNNCSPHGHDTVTDASGRLADISYECSQITVTNLPDTHRAAVVRFSDEGTINSSPPRLASTPRGLVYAAWSIQDGPVTDRLLFVPVLLGDLSTSRSASSSAGSVTVSGPFSCLPADTASVGVQGSPAQGWAVQQSSVTLGTTTLSGTLNGATLTANKIYSLIGHVTFTAASASKTVTATLRLRSCPAP
jgi:hypothetical protein